MLGVTVIGHKIFKTCFGNGVQMQGVMMTYYPDLSPYEYARESNSLRTLNVGWLDGVHKYAQATVPKVFVDRLWLFCQNPVFQTRGFHPCELCIPASKSIVVAYKGQMLELGSAEIRVLGKDVVYAAPDLIYHYVVEHSYCPPNEFIQAVLDGPLPGSQKYNIVADT